MKRTMFVVLAVMMMMALVLSACAPAPTPAPAAPAVPAAPGAPDKPDEAAPALAASLEAGNLRAVWDALPASYQRNVHELIHTFGENMDADVWKAGSGLLQKAIRVLKEKKEFLLKQPAQAQAPGGAVAAAENWEGLVGVLETIAASELADLQKLKTLDVSAFADGTGKKVADQGRSWRPWHSVT